MTAAIASLVHRLNQQQKAKSGAGNGEGTGAATETPAPPPPGSLAAKEALALRLDMQYPGGDVGVLSAFFLNLVRGGLGNVVRECGCY